MLFRWIHLSDIHFAYKDYHTNRLRRKLFDKLTEINRQQAINALFITGDITDKNAQYTDELNTFINQLLSIMGLTKDRLFMVPGNHDIARSSSRDEALLKIRKIGFNGICKLDTVEINSFLCDQSDFFDFYSRIKGEVASLEQVHYITKLSGVNIINMNTSWLCGLDSEEGELFIGSNKLDESLQMIKFNTNDINIALGHHNLNSFHKSEQDQLRSLFKEYNIDFYISGHIHKSSINFDSHIDTHMCVCRQTRSDDFDSGGFILGNIDTDKGNSFIEFHTWKQPGYWSLDNDVGLEAPSGTYWLNTAKFPSYKHNGIPILIIHKAMGAPINHHTLVSELGLKDPVVFQYQYSNLEIDSPDQWMEHKENTKSFINGILPRFNNLVYLTPLSQIPLLVWIGYLLQNDSNLSIYQLNEEQNWVLDSEHADNIKVLSTFTPNNPQSRRLAIKLEISSMINNSDLDDYVDTANESVISISLDEPERFKVLYQSQIRIIKNEFRRITEKYIANYDEIHLFCAVPAGLAIELGRCMLKSMWPKVYLYNYRRNNKPKYQFAFDIN